MKTYEFIEESWFASNGCSCCSHVLMECYNILGDYYTNGSAHSVEDCYRQTLELEGIIDPENDDLDDIDFEVLAGMNNIRIIIHFDEDIEED